MKVAAIAIAAVLSSSAAAWAGSAPIGYTIFCMNNRAECAPSSSVVVEYSPAMAAKLNQVNSSVNSSIKPKADKTETWSVNVSAGDCEDYALTKRKRLIAAGVPAGALRMATLRTADGVAHAVLVVKTTAGDMVLDNLRRSVVAKSATGYAGWRIASEDPMRW